MIVILNYRRGKWYPGHLWITARNDDDYKQGVVPAEQPVSLSFGAVATATNSPHPDFVVFFLIFHVEGKTPQNLEKWFADFQEIKVCCNQAFCLCTNNCTDHVRGGFDYLDLKVDRQPCCSTATLARSSCCPEKDVEGNVCCCVPTLGCSVPSDFYLLARKKMLTEMKNCSPEVKALLKDAWMKEIVGRDVDATQRLDPVLYTELESVFAKEFPLSGKRKVPPPPASHKYDVASASESSRSALSGAFAAFPAKKDGAATKATSAKKGELVEKIATPQMTRGY